MSLKGRLTENSRGRLTEGRMNLRSMGPPASRPISPLEGEMSRRDRGGSLGERSPRTVSPGERFPDERHPGESHLTKIHSTPSPNFPENLR